VTLPLDAAVPDEFADLIAANRRYAESHDLSGFDGIAHAGVAIVTCMDSRIDPLRMVGLERGDAKIIRNPGGRVTELAMEALVLGVHLLAVRRILVVPHTHAVQSRRRPSPRFVQRSRRRAAWTRRGRSSTSSTTSAVRSPTTCNA